KMSSLSSRLILNRYTAITYINLRFGIDFRAHQPHLVEKMRKGHPQHTQSVFEAAPEIDGAGLGEILGGTSDFGDFESRVEDLRDHLVVEHKVVGVGLVIDRLDHLPRKCPVTGV